MTLGTKLLRGIEFISRVLVIGNAIHLFLRIFHDGTPEMDALARTGSRRTFGSIKPLAASAFGLIPIFGSIGAAITIRTLQVEYAQVYNKRPPLWSV